MKFGELLIYRDVTVADIQDIVLVGLDIGDSVDVLTSEDKVIIDGHEISAVCVKPAEVYKIHCVKNFLFPLWQKP